LPDAIVHNTCPDASVDAAPCHRAEIRVMRGVTRGVLRGVTLGISLDKMLRHLPTHS
jgi:hypothetical protein